MVNEKSVSTVQKAYSVFYGSIDQKHIDKDYGGHEYIRPPVVIDILNKARIPWDLTVENVELHDGCMLKSFDKTKISKEEYVKLRDSDDPRAKRLVSIKNQYYVVQELNIIIEPYVNACVSIGIEGVGKRSHTGTCTVTAGGVDTAIKGAVSDAMKKAATLFGIGLQMYKGSVLKDIMEGDDTCKVNTIDLVRFTQAWRNAGIAAKADGKTDWEAITAWLKEHNIDYEYDLSKLDSKKDPSTFTKVMRDLSIIMEERSGRPWSPYV